MTTVQVSRRALMGAGAIIVVAATGAAHAASQIVSDIDAKALKQSKTTPLGLYLSPAAAHRALESDPKILFVDVRDPIEITYVGHPAGLDRIVPLRIATHDVDPSNGQYKSRENTNFLQDFEHLLEARNKTLSDPIFVSCRSGARSASAVRLLAKAGYTNVWNLIEGFEGDKTPEGARALNGWRNAGLPWSYKLPPGVAWRP